MLLNVPKEIQGSTEKSHYAAVLRLEIEEIWLKRTPTFFYSIEGNIKEEKM